MTAPNSYQVKLALVANCAACGQPRAVNESGQCPVCGEPLPRDEVQQVRDAVRARRSAFKVALQRLGQRVDTLAGKLSQFETRGAPLREHDYLEQVLRPAIATLRDPNPRVKQLLEGRVWDPAEDGTIAAFSELIGEMDASVAWIESLLATMPPIEWRGVHRELVRAAMAIVRGRTAMVATIAAVDLDAALKLQTEAETWFTQAARHAERIVRQIKVANDTLGDGPIQRDGSIDVAAAAWTSAGATPTSIAQAADIVREAFADVPGVSTMADEYAVTLLPILAMSARTVDYALLVARARQLRSVLDAADAVGSWIVDPVLLVEQVGSGLDRIADQIERMGREWRYGLPRHHVAHSLTEVYRELVEGALRELGGVILIAARAARQDPGGVYESAAVDGIKAGEIVDEFVRLGPPCADGIDMLYRNASAHASVVVTDTGITFTQREIRGGVASTRTESLTDEQFAEELVALQEVLLALQLALLPWMTGHGDAAMVAAVIGARPSSRQRDQALALLAGLAGLTAIAITADGDHVTITANPPTATADRIETNVLSVVPGAFGAVPAPARVTLALAGLYPVTFTRDEFMDTLNGEPHTAPLLGLFTAKWLLESTGSLSTRDEATYVTVPLADFHIQCAKLAPSDRDGALRSLQTVRARLDEVIPQKQRSDLTQAMVEQLDVLAGFLGSLAASGGSEAGDSADIQMRAQRAAASCDQAHHIGEAARLLRDTAGGSDNDPGQQRL